MREIIRSKFFIASIALLVIFAIYSGLVVSNFAFVTPIDLKIMASVRAVFDFLPLTLVVLITDFCFTSYFLPILIPLLGFCIYLRKYTTFFCVTIGFIALMQISSYLKHIVCRDRPDVLLQRIAETGFSYPSGHSTKSFFVGLILLYLINSWGKNEKFKYVFSIFVILWMLAVPFTRVWLGVHYPTDVIGGMLLGVTWGCFIISLIECFNSKKTYSQK